MSLVGTVINCTKEIDDALDFFLKQDNACFFQDVVIVDGGSSDGTWERLQDWASRYPQIEVIQRPGCAIGQGRNIAVERAKGDIIFVFDSGCTYCPNYVGLMLRPFCDDPEVEVVGGLSCPVGETRFERCLAALYDRERQDRTDPSHRSVVYRRRVWQLVGGYPPQVRAGEDSWFNLRWTAMGAKYLFVPQAKVYWRVRRCLRDLFEMERRNTCGWTMLGQYRLGVKLLGFYLALGTAMIASLSFPWFGVAVLCLVALWIWRRVFRKRQFWRMFSVLNLMSVISIVLVCDLGRVVGFIQGLGTRWRKQK